MNEKPRSPPAAAVQLLKTSRDQQMWRFKFLFPDFYAVISLFGCYSSSQRLVGHVTTDKVLLVGFQCSTSLQMSICQNCQHSVLYTVDVKRQGCCCQISPHETSLKLTFICAALQNVADKQVCVLLTPDTKFKKKTTKNSLEGISSKQ